MSRSTRVRSHLRANVVGYVALFFALTMGTAYATHPGGANTISTVDIINGEVKTADIGGGQVTTTDLNNDAVTGAKISNESIGNVDIKAGAVRASEIAAGAVRSAELASKSVTPAKLGERPAVRVSGVSTDLFVCPAVPSDTNHPLPWEFAQFDTGFGWAFSSCDAASQFVAPRHGLYHVESTLVWPANATGQRSLGVSVNGVAVAQVTQDANSAPETTQGVSDLLQANQNDVIRIFAFQNTGGDVTNNFFDSRSHAAVTWVGPLDAPAMAATETPRRSNGK